MCTQLFDPKVDYIFKNIILFINKKPLFIIKQKLICYL